MSPLTSEVYEVNKNLGKPLNLNGPLADKGRLRVDTTVS